MHSRVHGMDEHLHPVAIGQETVRMAGLSSGPENCEFKLGHYQLLRFGEFLVELSADLVACFEVYSVKENLFFHVPPCRHKEKEPEQAKGRRVYR